MNYTPSQTEAISAQKPEVLVSAAAGSGKTRVLTERVELLVRGADMEAFRTEHRKTTNLDRMQPVSSMLLVTFTRAAASEMRTRIVRALHEAAQTEPNPAAAERLRAESEAAAGADITTFHGFCRKVIAENYEAAGVAAGFTLLSESQASYLRSTCVREVFDELYEQRDEDARRMLSRFGRKGDDTPLLELVAAVHAQMMGNVEPQEWLHRSLADPKSYLDELLEMRRAAAAARFEELHSAAALLAVQEREANLHATKTAARDLDFLEKIENWQKLFAAGEDLGKMPANIPAAAGGEKALLEPVADLRERVRSLYKEVRELVADRDREADLADLRHTQQDVASLVRFVQLFEDKYAERKAASNRLDFADLEHRALRVLREHGAAYAQRYRYVFVDEYQDTNPVQEAILAAIHLDADGRPLNNQFLVGDMKQSIYGFRFADPTIFDSKSKSYGRSAPGEGTAQLIRMNDNFRSSPAVVCGVNAIMGELMDENLGDVAYTEAERLVCGRGGEPGQGVCQILLARPAEEEEGAARSGSDLKAAAEAEMIASRIEALHAAGRDYGDIAVLFRSRSSRLWSLANALEARGIPVASQGGGTALYVELEIFLNLLRLVVNDRQDVPLLSVLRSFMFGFDERELAWIAEWAEQTAEEEAADAPRRSRQLHGTEKREDVPFFRMLERFREEGPQASFTGEKQLLHERVLSKLRQFDGTLSQLRAEGTDMSLDRFAEAAADRVHLPSHLLTRPNGSARRRMFDQLLTVMRDLQQLHGNSLLRVLDAVDELRQQGTLFKGNDKTVQIPGVVRLMTVHGSKGLEFPVVFLAGLDGGFSTRSVSGQVLRSDRFGVTAQYVDADRHEQRDTLETETVKEYLRQRQRSEELRLLYVAMTRPREELYLCGVATAEDGDLSSWEPVRTDPQLAGSLLDWVMGAWLALRERGDAAAEMLADDGQPAPAGPEQAASAFDWETFAAGLAGRKPEVAPLGLAPRRRIAAQQGVAQLSELDFAAAGGGSRRRILQPVKDGGTEIGAARRGTLLHRFVRYAVSRHLGAEAALTAMSENRLITPEETETLRLDVPRVEQFLESDLYRRVQRAGRVLTEQRFRLLIDASETDSEAPPDAGKVRLRGIIDLAFLEEDGWVLVDYKTDRAADAELLERYQKQISLYGRALSEITGIPVKERYLYLFASGRLLPVPTEPIS